MLIPLVFGFLTGVLFSILGWWIQRLLQRKSFERQADELLQKSSEQTQLWQEEAEERAKAIEEKLWTAAEIELDEIEKRRVQLEILTDSKTSELKEVEQDFDRVVQSLHRKTQSLTDKVRRRQQIRAELSEKKEGLIRDWIVKLRPLSKMSVEEIKAEITQRFLQEIARELEQRKQWDQEELSENLEREAKRYLQLALNRFARPYCAERGIRNIEFGQPELFEKFLKNDRIVLEWVEKSCGIDITVNEEHLSLAVMGFDPVRRELGRTTLDRLFKDLKKNQPIDEKRVATTADIAKKELFKKIRKDGELIARELHLTDLTQEIKDMMGALRYRYSFAQNQYFHCAEVGWLCGLLSSELGLDLKNGRRAGLLHDIGKAMDHSKDGGHAVIGAEFIEKHGEKPEIVHAVRAHHFDEPPSSELAYLVIAADAISGARPGARRSTADSYSQKMASLEKITRSFPGVTGSFILSAGREVRVHVDAQRVDDMSALSLSKEIAHKIEEELSYPGLIKVTVVRQTQAVEMAR